MTVKELNQGLGNIDLYLLDQILKGRYTKDMKILDAGCGEGRNLIWFLRQGFPVWGVDKDPSALRMLRYVALSLDSYINTERFQQAKLENLPYGNEEFDSIICSAVLHFAENTEHFHEMFSQLVRVLKPKGTLFIRMTSDIGLEGPVEPLTDGRCHLPDGSLRFLLTRQVLSKLIGQYQLDLLEPVRTVNVQDQRCMTTLMFQKT